ncbi:hypothetical protein ACFLYX_00685 [Chloroflexota bacterium]
MEPTVLHMIGSNFNPAKEEEISIWYTTHHIPLIFKGPATRYELCQRISDDNAFPKYIAIYEFESEKVLNDYLRSPLPGEAHEDLRSWRERGDITDVWSINYKLIAKRGDNDRSTAFNLVATNLPRGETEEQFDAWYSYDHMFTVLNRTPMLIRFERYQRIGDDEISPKYLALHRYANETDITEKMKDTFLRKIDDMGGRRDIYPDGVWWDGTWRVGYKVISKGRKDDWLYI